MSATRSRRAVFWTADLRRVAGLPRRVWDDAELEQALTGWVYPELLTDEGRAEWDRVHALPEELRAEALRALGLQGLPLVPSKDQLKVLIDFVRCGGKALAYAPVGAGKTWLMYMGAALSERYFGASNLTVLVPAYLRRDTVTAHRAFAKFWRPPQQPIRVVTYNEISLRRNAFLLCACSQCTNGADLTDVYADIENPPEPIRPGYLGIDEVDVLSNVTKSAVGRRVARFFSNHDGSECRRLGGTGTMPVEDSVAGMFPILAWFFETKAPVPFEYRDRVAWAAALDDNPRGGSFDATALVEAFGGDVNAPDVRMEARRAYGKLLDETPGFIIVRKSSCDTAINMRAIPAPHDDAIEELFIPLRDRGLAVDEYIIGDSLSRRRYAVTLGAGWVDVWDPRPPSDWLEARNAYNAAVADVIRNASRRGVPLDTEAQARRRLKGSPVLETWEATRDKFTPNPVPIAISPSVVNFVHQWLQLNTPAIVWVSGTWLGETLEKLTSVSYYADNGLNRFGKPPRPGESIIASVQSNMRGRNWQAWNKMLIIGAFARASWIEQIVGRAHRQNQHDAVWVDFLAVSGESLRAFDRVRQRAAMGADLFGVRQKVLVANWDTTLLTSEYQDPELAGLGEGFAARWRQPVNVQGDE